MPKSLSFTFHDEGRPGDKTRYRLISQEPIEQIAAFEAFKRWAEKHQLSYLGSGKTVEIPYAEWRADKPR